MISFTNNEQSLLKDGKPWFPVMGEIHYSRYREELWEESLRKMKAGGLDIVSVYSFWIHHEEEEGVFRFDGCRSLRAFLELCKKVDIYVFLRIGPWVHGEARNGGFPDWLMNREKEGLRLRSDEEAYLQLVRRYWEELYKEAKGYFLKDDGPVIGVQIENEYGHVGGLNGAEGDQHMRTLQNMAKEIGFVTPYYTATGWGGAMIGDCLPVMGGYCEAPWDQSVTELSANTNFVFSHERNDALIACDHHVDGAVTFDESKFPYLTAELGGGLQVTGHRRPVARGKDVGAMSLVKMGSGANLLGYYMYHGGSNPEGKLSTLQESTATGYANDLPEINYDFNAPIKQYGTISDTYHEIRRIAYFLKEFGSDLAPLKAQITPEVVKPEDMKTLRVSCRHDDNHGYVFFNNYQRRRSMKKHNKVSLRGLVKNGEVVFPPMDIKDGDYGFFPYNMKLGDKLLKRALATPLCKINDTYVFYGDYDPAYIWGDNGACEILHLSEKDSLNAYKVTLDKDYLVLHDNFVWEENGKLKVVAKEGSIIKVWPELPKAPKGFKKCGKDKPFTCYKKSTEDAGASVVFQVVREEETCTEVDIRITYGKNFDESALAGIAVPQKNLSVKDRVKGYDVLLKFTYGCNDADLYVDGKKVNDYFYTGQKGIISLGYLNFPTRLRLVMHPLYEDARVFLEKKPEFTDGKACYLKKIKLIETFTS